MKLRFVFLSLAFVALYGILGARLYSIQVVQNPHYVERAQARSEAFQESRLQRGEIFVTDRYNNEIPVALHRGFPVVYAVPKHIPNPQAAAEQLAPAIGWEEGKLQGVLDNPQSLFRLLVEKASSSVVQAVSSLDIPGIAVEERQYRFYPFGRLASHVLGFVGVNQDVPEPAGLYGVEKLHNTTLAQGKAQRLTLDRTIQAKAEEMLGNLVSRFTATGGTIIVQEPVTGRILALANKPDFDPSAYSDFSIGSFLNPAVQSVYEPGSVFKPFTMAAGIDLGVITPETSYVDRGSVTLDGKTIHNARNEIYGRITMTNVIKHSVNTGAVFAVQQIGRQSFERYLRLFGFGERTGIDLPDEVGGSLRNLKRSGAKDIDFATASFGQGTAVTPVQLITAYSALANGGLLMRPSVSRDEEPLVVRRVVKKETAEQVIQMMEKAVENAGVAVIPQYRIAGKTGTALIPDFKEGGYTDEMIHTFVGFAPASRPLFTVLVKLDKPQVGDLAGRTVVPSFRDLTQFLLNYYSVAPDALPATSS